MRTLTALMVVGLLLFPGCTYFESDEGIEEEVIVDIVRGCTDETAENYNQSAEGGKDDTGRRDPAKQKTEVDAEQVAQEKPSDNNTYDASLVNITV